MGPALLGNPYSYANACNVSSQILCHELCRKVLIQLIFNFQHSFFLVVSAEERTDRYLVQKDSFSHKQTATATGLTRVHLKHHPLMMTVGTCPAQRGRC
ncbi:3-(3-hydroxy-phenyl)propionate/3-hydroxycinnamic acid hydroxylase [Fusarium oxysporum f. sp. albedinis]|nr:3-(3-hydroxy-phenyl)propionate/3-hydroxycinnamic acid hydroxylase [Fusarium oxysporum f. sp. albedinis]